MGNCDLTEIEMKILLLWDHQHMDTFDIARLMGMSESEVHVTLWRVREKRRRSGNAFGGGGMREAVP